MILFFSGTGNSEYAAKRIGLETGDETVNLFDKIRSCDFSEMTSLSPWVVVAPTYSWRIPRIIQEWLKNTTLSGCRDIYFVLTCGGNIGNAGKYLKKLCRTKGMNYRGCFEVVMPENYIAMFATPSPDEAREIISRAEHSIDEAAHLIKNKVTFSEPKITIKDRTESGIVNSLFYPFCVSAKRFYATDLCVSCGKCVRVCPLNNIRLENGKPVWGRSCTHCMACICRCPAEAVEYGKHSLGLPRYTFPSDIAE